VCDIVNFGFTIPTTAPTRRVVRVALGPKKRGKYGCYFRGVAYKICFIKNILALERGYIIVCSFRFVVGLKKVNNGEKIKLLRSVIPHFQ